MHACVRRCIDRSCGADPKEIYECRRRRGLVEVEVRALLLLLLLMIPRRARRRSIYCLVGDEPRQLMMAAAAGDPAAVRRRQQERRRSITVPGEAHPLITSSPAGHQAPVVHQCRAGPCAHAVKHNKKSRFKNHRVSFTVTLLGPFYTVVNSNDINRSRK